MVTGENEAECFEEPLQRGFPGGRDQSEKRDAASRPEELVGGALP